MNLINLLKCIDREDIIFKLFRKHQKELQERGIEISLTQVLAANGLA